MLAPGDPARRAHAVGALDDEEWDAVCQAAHWLGVAPTLHGRVAGTPLPDHARSRNATLRDDHMFVLLQNEAILDQVRELIDIADEADCPVAALKGAAVAFVAYHDRGERPMGDIDVLVPREEARRFFGCLTEHGYEPVRHPDAPSTHHHLPPLTRPNGLPVELHTDLAPPAAPFRVDLGGVWHRVRTTPVQSLELPHPTPEDLILHACTHAAYDDEFRLGLRAACDVDALVRRFDTTLDWPLLVRIANEDGRSRFVYTALRVAGELLGVSIAEHTLHELEHSGADDEIVADAVDLALSTAPGAPHAWRRIRDTDGSSSRLAILARSLFPAPSDLRRMYGLSDHDSLARHYLRRPFDVIARRGRTLTGLALGASSARALREKEDRRSRIRDWSGRHEGGDTW